MKILADYHHDSLYTSLQLLFEKRLGFELFRPGGMEWFEQGYWAINDQRDTAQQFLAEGDPGDGTPVLTAGRHNTVTLEEFIFKYDFDYLIASIPQHVAIFQELIDKYHPKAKLIVQVGNNWDLGMFEGLPILASVKPKLAPPNVHFYRQEFDLEIFHPEPVVANGNIYSFVNIIQNTGSGYSDFSGLKAMLERFGFNFRAFGGQCPNGNMNGPQELADKMREAMMIFHVKPGGDGYGHVIHNAYAVGRPLITRPSHYRGQLAEDLLVPGTFIDLDKYTHPEIKNMLHRLLAAPEQVQEMGEKAAARFRDVVDFDKEAKEVSKWLQNLK